MVGNFLPKGIREFHNPEKHPASSSNMYDSDIPVKKKIPLPDKPRDKGPVSHFSRRKQIS